MDPSAPGGQPCQFRAPDDFGVKPGYRLEPLQQGEVLSLGGFDFANCEWCLQPEDGHCCAGPVFVRSCNPPPPQYPYFPNLRETVRRWACSPKVSFAQQQSVALTLVTPLFGPVFWRAVDAHGADFFLLLDTSWLQWFQPVKDDRLVVL